jgi:hypothetical protein
MSHSVWNEGIPQDVPYFTDPQLYSLVAEALAASNNVTVPNALLHRAMRTGFRVLVSFKSPTTISATMSGTTYCHLRPCCDILSSLDDEQASRVFEIIQSAPVYRCIEGIKTMMHVGSNDDELQAHIDLIAASRNHGTL